jgi:hypothetical protein
MQNKEKSVGQCQPVQQAMALTGLAEKGQLDQLEELL